MGIAVHKWGWPAAWAAGLDRAGDLVRVVLPFGNLMVVSGTEPAVQMAGGFHGA